MAFGAIGAMCSLLTDAGRYSRPHLQLMRYAGYWLCRDRYRNFGYGRTPAAAYNAWLDSVQLTRLANGYFPAPLKRAPVTVSAARQ